MKNIFIIILFIVSISSAQSVDTLKTASTNSVDIRALVQKQIDDARAHKSTAAVDPKPVVENKIIAPIKNDTQPEASVNPLVVLLINQPVSYKIYEVISFLIVGFVLIRRTIRNFGKNSMKNLKFKIGLMREEKIAVAKVNPKMTKARKFLKDNLEIFRQNDQQLAKTARQLNVSKGELLLAARLKFFEMKKM